MSADVLAVLDAVAATASATATLATPARRSALKQRAADCLQARAAVAELIEAARELDEELDGPPIAHRLRAALASVTGAQS